MKKILVIGRHLELLSKIKHLLEENGYFVYGTVEDQEAKKLFKKYPPDAVIIGGGVDNESRKLLYYEFHRISPLIKIFNAHPQTVLNSLNKAFEI